MKVGLFIPNGIQGEFADRDVTEVWNRSLEIARLADELGFDAVWAPDHLQNVEEQNDAPTFEAILHLMAIANVTSRARLSPGVACVGFRNPALLAKMMTTLDVASGGRAELAIGAGWNQWEWTGYGYGFPPARERLKLLREGLEVITRMLEPGHASWQGDHYEVNDAICEPKGVQLPRIPIIVGGNGPKVTWRLAARYADELNLDEPSIDQIRDWLPTIRQRCEEIDRDPATLRLSALFGWNGATGSERVEGLVQLAELGMTRIQCASDGQELDSDEPLHQLAEDCRAAGVELLS